MIVNISFALGCKKVDWYCIGIKFKSNQAKKEIAKHIISFLNGPHQSTLNSCLNFINFVWITWTQ
jgi:hypothetical protein